jgi:hypothetical protein
MKENDLTPRAFEGQPLPVAGALDSKRGGCPTIQIMRRARTEHAHTGLVWLPLFPAAASNNLLPPATAAATTAISATGLQACITEGDFEIALWSLGGLEVDVP